MNKEKINKILFYLYNYENIDDLIEQRKNEIIDTVNVSSIAWIKSKQGNGNTLEDQVIKLIEDPLILEYKRWQSLIKKELDLIKNTDLDTFNIVNSRFSGATFEKIENELFIGDRTVKRLYNDFIIEISFLAIKNGLIHI